MSLLIELVMELLAEGLIASVGNSKIPKSVRVALVAGLYIAFCGLLVFIAVAADGSPLPVKLILAALGAALTGLLIYIINKIRRGNGDNKNG